MLSLLLSYALASFPEQNEILAPKVSLFSLSIWFSSCWLAKRAQSHGFIGLGSILQDWRRVLCYMYHITVSNPRLVVISVHENRSRRSSSFVVRTYANWSSSSANFRKVKLSPESGLVRKGSESAWRGECHFSWHLTEVYIGLRDIYCVSIWARSEADTPWTGFRLLVRPGGLLKLDSTLDWTAQTRITILKRVESDLTAT